MYKSLLLACLFALANRAQSQIEGPFELPNRFAKAHFAQTSVADCSFPMGFPRDRAAASHMVGDLVVRLGGKIRVEGRDHAGTPWSVEVEIQYGGCSIWRADLDQDGHQDLIVWTSNATSGGESTLTLVLVDAEGRPLPWHAVGHFDEGERWVANLVDLDKNGRAELLFLHVEGIYRGRARSMSLSLYDIRNAHLKRVDGRFGTEVFPVLTPRGTRPAEEPDLTNTLGGSASDLTIKSLIPERPGYCGVLIPMGYLLDSGDPNL